MEFIATLKAHINHYLQISFQLLSSTFRFVDIILEGEYVGTGYYKEGVDCCDFSQHRSLADIGHAQTFVTHYKHVRNFTYLLIDPWVKLGQLGWIVTVILLGDKVIYLWQTCFVWCWADLDC